MTDMVERAARAACEYQGYDPDPYQVDEGLRWPGWRKHEGMMRAALEAAFKVTDEDADIFFGRGKEKAGTEFVNHGWLRDFKTGMQALSDAALGEGS